MNKTLGILAALALIGTTVAANYLTTRYGFVSVGFGLMATAGTYAAGLALGLRDIVNDTLGRWVVLVVILIGAAMSYAVADPFIATASAAAFLLSELADMTVYVPLRRRAQFGDRRWTAAVAASNTVGATVDTIIFLGLAFGAAAITGQALAGQFVGKGWATLAIVAIGVAGRALLRQPVNAERA